MPGLCPDRIVAQTGKGQQRIHPRPSLIAFGEYDVVLASRILGREH